MNVVNSGLYGQHDDIVVVESRTRAYYTSARDRSTDVVCRSRATRTRASRFVLRETCVGEANLRVERMHYTPNCAAQQVELNHPKFRQPLQATNEAASRCSLGSFSLLSGYGNMAAVAAASQHPALGSVSRTPLSSLLQHTRSTPQAASRLSRSHSFSLVPPAVSLTRVSPHSFSPPSRVSLPRSRISSLPLAPPVFYIFLRRFTWPPYDASPFGLFLL